MAKVKCPVCEEEFDRGKEDYFQVKRRYIHEKCRKGFEEMEKTKSQKNLTGKLSKEDTQDRKDLIDYYMELHKLKRPNGLALKQMKELNAQGYSYKGMKSTLYYFHEVLGNPVIQGTGIGIVAYVYEDAIKWYTNKVRANKSYKQFLEDGEELVTVRKIDMIRKGKNTLAKSVDLSELEKEAKLYNERGEQ